MGEGGAEELLEGDDEAFGEHGLLRGGAVGVEGEADDDGVDGFAFDELGDGLGELFVGEIFEHFEGEGEAAVGGAGFADGEAGAFVAEVDAEETHGEFPVVSGQWSVVRLYVGGADNWQLTTILRRGR